MEVIAAAGFCAPGCAAAVSAIAGGPILGAVGVVAAVGYGVYSLATGGPSSKHQIDDIFLDAIEEDEERDMPSSPVVKVSRQHQTTETRQTPSASFL